MAKWYTWLVEFVRINFFIDIRLTFILFRQVFCTVPEKLDNKSNNQETTTTLQLLHKQHTQKSTTVTTELEEEATSGGTPPNSVLSTTQTLPSVLPLSLLCSSPVPIHQTGTPPWSSPGPIDLHSSSHQPLSPARHTNTDPKHLPAPRPVKFTHKGYHWCVSASSTGHQSHC